MQGLERSVVSVSSSGAAVGGFVPKTSRSPVSPVPDGCGSVPKENRNRADGRHTRCSRRTWPNRRVEGRDRIFTISAQTERAQAYLCPCNERNKSRQRQCRS